MTPTRKRRLIVISFVLAAVAVAAGLTALALQQNMTYLYSPSEVEAGHAPAGARFRLGGVVLEQSVVRSNDSLDVEFVVTDRFKEMPVKFTGILPDLFREGQSIVATGELQDGRFVASEVLAKHDETYMPKEVADAIAKAKDTQPAK
ncbi:MAG TPA: cytochrome c maturation protein CcmE [Dokdonella sp.]